MFDLFLMAFSFLSRFKAAVCDCHFSSRFKAAVPLPETLFALQSAGKRGGNN
jgi:hypothetical protein